jgi:hypothetical protein
LARAARLHELLVAGELPGPEQHEVHPNLPLGSRENYLYFMLPCAVNFQRNSPALWRSALETYEDPETRYVFFPEEVAKHEFGSFQAAVTKHRLALQTNTHTKILWTISHTLHEHFDNDPRVLFASYNHDVRKIVQALQVERKPLFPYLGGTKLSNYCLFIISEFTDAPLRNLHEISIIPDTHVIRSTVRLGLLEDGCDARAVEAVWRPLLRELRVPPTEMHTALWRWSRSGFCPDI